MLGLQEFWGFKVLGFGGFGFRLKAFPLQLRPEG